ncbi:MAG: lipopolysaccharide kinase InaA family protein [Dokdonia sp.]|jgi:hypothetical protein
MRIRFAQKYKANANAIKAMLAHFDREGTTFDKGARNTIKVFDLNGQSVNIKSFKKPNIVNKIVYRFFRTSKARRSFEYANILIEKGIGTPHPVAYAETTTSLFFGESYYISEHIDYDLTYRELIRDSKYAGNPDILAAFAAFTFKLHQQGVHFKDHSPGNTLIQILDHGYAFYLVDLNRMEFGRMTFEQRMKNFERLSRYESHVRIMAKAYAAQSNEPEAVVYEHMWKAISDFQTRFYRKKRLKKKLAFWK